MIKEGSHYRNMESGEGHHTGEVNLGQGTWPGMMILPRAQIYANWPLGYRAERFRVKSGLGRTNRRHTVQYIDNK